MKLYFAQILLMLMPLLIAGQNPAPAPPQEKRILYMNGTVHTGDGRVIENCALGFENGKLKLVADATLIRIIMTEYDTLIDFRGKHIYPGLIALNTTLGISEIEAVRATNDHTETGTMNPSSRALIAYNTDSKVIPTVRSNGVLLAQIVPKGGVVSGQSSVVELDAWNFEDAGYKSDIGIHLNWPSMRTIRSRSAESEEKQKRKTDQEISEINKLFADAKAYSAIKSPLEKNLHLESMRGLFDGTKNLYVHCNYVKEIIAAAGLCRQYGINMVLVGGTDSWMVSELLKQQNIPVVLVQTHRLPSREDEDIDQPYKLPSMLKKAGVNFAISIPGFWQVQNLAFQAGTSVAHGLDKETALAAVTSQAAAILGIGNSTGTLREGMDATFIVSSGDLLDMKTSVVESAYIRGRQIDLDNIHKQLNVKFRKKYGFN